MEFQCRLAVSTGEIVEGVYSAESEAQLRNRFDESGFYVLSLRKKGVFGSLKISGPKARRLNFREFLVFNQELATLLSAGMPLVQSLDIVRTRIENPLLKSVLDTTYERVRSGTALSEAFAAHGTLIPGVYIASLTAGERSGSLEEVIRRYVDAFNAHRIVTIASQVLDEGIPKLYNTFGLGSKSFLEKKLEQN